jgi:hypothetical protein
MFTPFFQYLKGILFAPNQKLKAHDLNEMQNFIAKGVKKRLTTQKYDALLEQSRYQYSFIEDFTNDDFQDKTLSDAVIIDYLFAVQNGTWVSKMLNVPSSKKINEFCVLMDREEQTAFDVYYRHDISEAFISLPLSTPVVITGTGKEAIQIQFKANAPGSNTNMVYDYAFLWK